MKEKKLLLNLGCADDIRPDYENIDLCIPAEAYEKFSNYSNVGLVQHDLSTRWPYEDSSVDFIRAADIFEHLPDKIFTMNEAWRVLKPGCVLFVAVPTTDGRGAFQDPTHMSYWNRNSFFYFTNKDPHRERFGDAYGIRARFDVHSENSERLADYVTKLSIMLLAVK